MRKLGLVVGAVCLAMVVGAAERWRPPGTETVQELEDLVAGAQQRYSELDFYPAKVRLDLVIGSKAFAHFQGERRAEIFRLHARASARLGDRAAALQSYRRLCAMPQAQAMDWHERLDVAYRQGETEDAVASLTTIAQRWPFSLLYVSDDGVFRTYKAMAALLDSGDKRVALLQALMDANWQPRERWTLPDGLWFDLVVLRLERKQIDDAVRVALAIKEPTFLVRMLVDRRFDAVTAPWLKTQDVLRYAQGELAEARAVASEEPERLEAVNPIAVALLNLGKYEDALALVEGVLARARPPGGDSPFIDLENNLNWTREYRARALYNLGRLDEAFAEWNRAARLPENGTTNVSQAINLSDHLFLEGRPREALEAVAELTHRPREISRYGIMQLEEARACSYAQLKDDANMRRSVDYIRAHAPAAPVAVFYTLLCVDDLDAAAAALIGWLNDPETRPAALAEMQDYLAPGRMGSFAKTMDERWHAVRSRPDVQAAILAYGRIVSLAVAAPWQ